MINLEYLYNKDIDIKLGVIEFKQVWNGDKKEIWCHYKRYKPSHMVTIFKKEEKYCKDYVSKSSYEKFNKYYNAKTCILDNPMKELLNYVCEVVEKEGENVKVERNGNVLYTYTMSFNEFNLIHSCTKLIINGKEISGYGASDIFFYLEMLLKYIEEEFDYIESKNQKEKEENELKKLFEDMKKNKFSIISNNTNSGDIVIQDSSKGKTIINGKVYEGHNIKISNNQVFVDNKLVDEVLQDESNIKKDLFQDVEDRGIGYMGVLESLIKEIESYGNEKILNECSFPNKTWEETKEEYIRYYTDDTFETYWLWIAISDLSNKLAESLKN